MKDEEKTSHFENEKIKDLMTLMFLLAGDLMTAVGKYNIMGHTCIFWDSLSY